MEKHFIRFATATARVAGMPWTFATCVAVVVLWAASGPMFGFSATWQLVINTGTTIVTFLMVFLIQNTQNRDGAAMQAKLDELIHAVRKADEGFIGIEHLTERDLKKILEQVEERAARIHGNGKDALPVVATREEDVRAAGKAKARTRPARSTRRAGRAKAAS